MKNPKLIFLFLVLLFLFTSIKAHAFLFNTDLQNPSITTPNPWLEATFSAHNDGNDDYDYVLLEMSATGIGTGYVSEWYFNLDDAYDPGDLDISWHSGQIETSYSQRADWFKADGFKGRFDIKFDFPTSGDKFTNTETSVFKISYSDGNLQPGDFEFWSADPDSNYKFLAAAKIQGGESPNWVAAVPIPSAVWLLASGLIGLAVIRRRKAQ